MQKIENKLDLWKKKLLDMGKRNKLLNYKKTKRSNITIIAPKINELFKTLVEKNGSLSFDYALEYGNKSVGEEEEYYQDVIKGDITVDKNISEQQKTLRNLRLKAKTAIDEQGVNLLYLACGFLKWKETPDSKDYISSPIILIPVSLTITSISDPFRLEMIDDEVVVNPTLINKLLHDFNIELPPFDYQNDDIMTYLKQIDSRAIKNYWEVDFSASIGMFSFLKINMYNDLDSKAGKIKENNILLCIAGDKTDFDESSGDISQYENYDFDNKLLPKDSLLILDADSSQQDAVLFAQKGISFVLQGPPGTGKSQTISNIIAESIGKGKKVLFVAEKMAALEVVYKRLEQAGLGDFCFRLHSHKANKKAVLTELGNMLNIQKFKVNDEVLRELDFLERDRRLLNEYASQLHTKVVPLNKSIFEVNGQIAKLANTKEIIFNINNVGRISAEQYSEIIYNLNALEIKIKAMSGNYKDNPWYGFNKKTLTHELRHDIENKLKKIAIYLGKYNNEVTDVFVNAGIHAEFSFFKIKDLLGFFEHLAAKHSIAENWLNTDIAEIEKYAQELASNKVIRDKNILFLQDDFDKKLFSVKANEKCTSVDALITKIVSNSQLVYDINIANGLINFERDKAKIKEILTTLAEGEKAAKELYSLFGLNFETTLEKLIELKKLCEILIGCSTFQNIWFAAKNITDIKKLLNDSIKKQAEQIEARNFILSKYDASILDLDHSQILLNLKIKYARMFRGLKSGYRHIKNSVAKLIKDKKEKISYSLLLSLFEKIKNLKETEKWFESNAIEIKNKLGIERINENTNWTLAETTFNAFIQLQEYFSNEIPVKFREYLTMSPSFEMLTIAIAKIERTERAIKNDAGKYVSKELLGQNDDCKFFAKKLNNLLETFNEISEQLNEINVLSKDEISCQNTYNALIKLRQIQDYENVIKKEKTNLTKVFEHLFIGQDTPWQTVVSEIGWTKTYKEKAIALEFDRNSIIAFAETNNLDFKKLVSKSEDILADLSIDVDWFVDMFDSKDSLRALPISKFVFKLNDCFSNLLMLEEWVDFMQTINKCKQIGISEFVDIILGKGLKHDEIIKIFNKRFFRLWMDEAMKKFTSIENFRGKNHNDLIQEFGKYDKNQFKINATRTRSMLLANLPNFNSMTVAYDEVGILKRELNKQRKIMPLRKLFASIPNLLSKMKPCFMMSPLSVSLFLQSDNYDFDLVIFDEASQVKTEDAIGAIIRGKQVIITGDSKQLPPTNFFNSAVAEDEYDTDDEDMDDGAYDSILDEAVNFLPEKTLRWHYRSRHEYLIAFSNTKIYRHNLITFPAPVERVANNGVEYFYIENGIYDRGGKKDNLIEAQKIVSLIEDHIKTTPSRSIGVVTFSEAQQNCIETLLRKFRLNNRQFEDFFREDKEESFFVKNIENVQGDERDTIIFSIGYGKDNKGVMYMNFGPLSKNGGYRRLNVAITRAKYNVKLVGSILPTDINLDKTSSEGVKMLRDYIDFAIHGKEALESELITNMAQSFDSTFEEAIYDYLSDKGFAVQTQVGCSGYRVDLAIKHPTLAGRYVLGVECDGAAYHSSRTARERDRLRQDVLENMGWKIYRVWSTDWIKDPISEGKKLVEYVEECISKYIDKDLNKMQDKTSSEKAETDEVFIKCDEIVENQIDDLTEYYGFKGYVSGDISKIDRYHFTSGREYENALILKLIEYENPISFELLCKKMAPIYGNQKATIKITGHISYMLKNWLSQKVDQRNGFCYLRGAEIVVRTPQAGDALRPIEYISQDELELAAIKILEKSLGISQKDLINLVAKVYRYARVGPNIVESITKAINSISNNGKIKIVEGKISLL